MLIDPLPGWAPAPPLRRLLIAGATGRFGEALLNEAIARRGLLGFDEVVALGEADKALGLGLAGLAIAPLQALPPLTTAILSLSDPHAQDARSFHGRDAPFVLVDALRVHAVAAAAIAAGAQHLVLVHPLPAWQQLSGLHQGLVGEAELQLSQLPCRTMLVMRPVAASSSAGGNLIQRIVRVYLSLQMLMLPTSLAELTSAQLAKAVVGQLSEPATAGVNVMGAADIQGWLQRQKTA